jgi:hypothetical protein
MAPLDQAALTRWVESRCEEEKTLAHEAQKASGMGPTVDPTAGGRRYAFVMFRNRMKAGDLPELDDVQQILAEFPNSHGSASPFRHGQDEAKAALRAKVEELMA